MVSIAKIAGLSALGLVMLPAAAAKELPSTEGIDFSEPVLDEAKLASPFGIRNDPLRDRPNWHGGIDLSADWNDPVHAPAGGEIVYADSKSGYGRMVDLKLSDGWVIRMAHLSEIHVAAGDQVEAGQVLGAVGSPGRDIGPHLHLEARFNDKQYNPEHIETLSFFKVEKSGD